MIYSVSVHSILLLASVLTVSGQLPPVRVRVWVRVSVSFRVGRQFYLGAIVLEPCLTCFILGRSLLILELELKS